MTVEIENNTKKDTPEKASFMLPIWTITLLTMVGTGFASYAYHAYALNKQHNENMREVRSIEARIEKHTEYRDIIKKDGKEAAFLYLNKE